MPERLRAVADYFPFLALAVGSHQTPLVTRLMETAIMSIVAGGVGIYVGVAVMKNDLEYLKGEMRDIKQSVEQIRRDMYVPRGIK